MAYAWLVLDGSISTDALLSDAAHLVDVTVADDGTTWVFVENDRRLEGETWEALPVDPSGSAGDPIACVPTAAQSGSAIAVASDGRIAFVGTDGQRSATAISWTALRLRTEPSEHAQVASVRRGR